MVGNLDVECTLGCDVVVVGVLLGCTSQQCCQEHDVSAMWQQ
jgi:hypothetical protein